MKWGAILRGKKGHEERYRDRKGRNSSRTNVYVVYLEQRRGVGDLYEKTSKGG